jgi:hypothetical protein
MDPSCLGAKGDPRRMEQYTKDSLNILRLPDSAITQSVHSVRDLSTVRAVNSLHRDLVLTSCFCACVCCDLSLACVALPLLLMCFLCDRHCKGERLQLVEIPRKREEYSKEKTMVFKLIIGSLERD